jgi:hypothetical protein
MKIQLSKGVRSRTSIMMLCVTLVLFAISTGLWSLDVVQLIQGYKVMLYQNNANDLSQGVDKRYELLAEKSPFMEGFFLLTMIIGDSVVIWRAWVISGGHKITLLPIAFILTSIAFGMLDIFCITEADGVQMTSVPAGSRLCTWSEPIAWAISLCTNILSTSIIAFKVWSHRKFIKETLGEYRLHSRAERLMMLLVESGFVYSLFWVRLFSVASEQGSRAHIQSSILSYSDDMGCYLPTVHSASPFLSDLPSISGDMGVRDTCASGKSDFRTLPNHYHHLGENAAFNK